MKLTDEDLSALLHTKDLGLICSFDELKFIARAVIEESNKKVLADLKPVQERIAVKMYGYAIFAEIAAKEDLYSADQVAALIQERDAQKKRIDELEEQVKSLEESLDTHAPERP